ncbi:hypothetical protein CMALT430_200044 [Carnobacterium maltaromaticum]|nr:hypothetical protein CMALT430_200044 [Carnobacterium maltaromaticum]
MFFKEIQDLRRQQRFTLLFIRILSESYKIAVGNEKPTAIFL